MKLKTGDLVKFKRDVTRHDLFGDEGESVVIRKGDYGLCLSGVYPEHTGILDVVSFSRYTGEKSYEAWCIHQDWVKRVPQYAQPWRPGMKVTTNKEIDAYYSGYHRPVQMYRPGMVGTIGAILVPFVSSAYKTHTKHPYFVCVDFIGDDGEKWRAGVDYENLVGVEE